MRVQQLLTVVFVALLGGCSAVPTYDVIVRNGLIYDGSGTKPFRGDVAINGDVIAAVFPADSEVGRYGDAGGRYGSARGRSRQARGRTEIDAAGLAVAPGFINMLSWANESLIHDGRSQSDIRQGVTLEVLGEGTSMGPLSDAMKQEQRERQDDIKYDVAWTTLGEYLDWLTAKGISCNVASFVGATTARVHVIGYDDRKATPEELDRMRELVRQAMKEGAVGVSSSLIYTPAFFADTEELIALATVAAEYDGMYISHIRNEGDRLLEALDEFLTIARESGARSEIYHLKASGRDNWGKLDRLFAIVEAARAEGLPVTADMYMYHASATGLDATMPPWVQEGGHKAWVERLKDPEIRARVKQQMTDPTGDWDAGFKSAGSAENILLVGFRNKALRHLTGKTLAEVAVSRGKSPEEAAMDLVIEDDSRVGSVFFTMSEDNVRREIQRPWVSFCSDSESLAPEGLFLNQSLHPRAYGSFARLLGKFVREEKLIPLEEAIRKLTSLPAGNLKLDRRGRLAEGYFADVVVFDPETIEDRATFAQPHQYAVGVVHVLVNGTPVLKDGEHTDARPGRFLRGPGARQQSR